VQYLYLFKPADSSLISLSDDPFSAFVYSKAFKETYTHIETTPVFADETKIDDPTFEYDSDVVYVLHEEEYLEVTSGRKTQIPYEVSYSPSGNTPLLFMLSGTPPPWVSIDNTTGVVTADTSKAAVGVIYSFGIEVAVSVATNWTQTKLVKIKVLGWINPAGLTKYCIDCANLYAPRCGTWAYGYELSASGIWDKAKPTDAAQAAQETSQAQGGAGVLIGGIIAILNLSSPLSIWLIANQMQLLMLILLTGAYFPPSVVKLITEGSNLSFSVNLIPIESLPAIKVVPKLMGFKQDNEYLYKMGITNGSSLATNLMFFVSLFWVIALHWVFWCVPKWKKKLVESKKRKWLRVTMKKINDFFKFAVYIRLSIEAYQFMVLSSVYDLKKFKYETPKHLASLILSFILIFYCIIIPLFSVFLLFKIELKLKKTYRCFRELFSGQKATKLGKFYVILTMFLRKLIHIPFLMWVSHTIEVTNVVLIMLLVESVIFVYLLTSRPFETSQDFILEIVNEVIFLSLISFLFFINQPEDWNELNETIFMYIFTSNNLLITVVLFGKYLVISNLAFLIKSSCVRLKKWREPKSKVLVKFRNPREGQVW
jgi:hypothetical protein